MIKRSPLETDTLHFLEHVAALSYCNPFTPQRLALEHKALGSHFVKEEENWNVAVAQSEPLRNISQITARAEQALIPLRDWLSSEEDTGSTTARARFGELYKDVVFFILYHRYRAPFLELIAGELSDKTKAVSPLYDQFQGDVQHFFRGVFLESEKERDQPMLTPHHLFALAFQIARAFFQIYQYMIGVSKPMQELRARVWESIFTCNLKQYNRVLFNYLGEVTTLITGPSGTGKELVARAVGLSRYLPFDEKKRAFTQNFSLSFFPVQLSAYPATLIESELFGHTRGAFTGAVRDRKGWLEECGAFGTVFLDEIGEIEESVQVKLLRVLEQRESYRLGDNKRLTFHGKLIAATNRRLEQEIARGAFRADLYYRLCADQIVAPALSIRLSDAPEELEILVRYIVKRVLRTAESEQVVEATVKWITKNIPGGYSWPGNVRELEQCVRNVLIHGSYHPHQEQSTTLFDSEIQHKIAALSLTAEELVSWYCGFAHEKLESYEETGRKLGLDRRTVKARVG